MSFVNVKKRDLKAFITGTVCFSFEIKHVHIDSRLDYKSKIHVGRSEQIGTRQELLLI